MVMALNGQGHDWSLHHEHASDCCFPLANLSQPAGADQLSGSRPRACNVTATSSTAFSIPFPRTWLIQTLPSECCTYASQEGPLQALPMRYHIATALPALHKRYCVTGGLLHR